MAKSIPFFARFLERQYGGGDKPQTLKYPSDSEEDSGRTLKYPSDTDELPDSP